MLARETAGLFKPSWLLAPVQSVFHSLQLVKRFWVFAASSCTFTFHTCCTTQPKKLTKASNFLLRQSYRKKKENEKMSATGNAHLNLCQSQATTPTVFRGLGRQTNKCTSEHNGKVYFAKAWLVNWKDICRISASCISNLESRWPAKTQASWMDE